MKALARYRWTLLALAAIVTVAAIRLLGTSDTVEHDGLTFAGPSLARALESPSGAPGTRAARPGARFAAALEPGFTRRRPECNASWRVPSVASLSGTRARLRYPGKDPAEVA